LDLPEDSQLKKPIETIRESGSRAAAIVQDLLTVARGVAITRENVNPNDIVKDYLESPEFKKVAQFYPDVTVKTELAADLLRISGSAVHVRKAVMNLVSNAAEAIGGVGRIILSTANCYVDRPISGYDDVEAGEYILMSVSDDGSGIKAGDLNRIFEPFYTKKVMGRSGTGLGLAVVWNVVQDHNGYIDVITGSNGTTFDLYLPVTRDEIEDTGTTVSLADFQGNGETILVVDDVNSQREISCEILSRLGYRAIAVSSGEEAVDYLTDHSVDLVLLDMLMDPGITARETYARIVQQHPGQKAVIISGFAETGDVRETQKLGAGPFVKKPVTLEKLGMAIKTELGN
ncbi:MAG: response regulator, partial [Desulfobacterales bacterium]|nr:response regulator [Desulfobacterales bacterium]